MIDQTRAAAEVDATATRPNSWTRRAALQAGGAGLLALSGQSASPLGRFDSLSEREAAPSPSERSVILLMMMGGASATETFDPRPDAPDHQRGPFESIASRVPGVRLVEHLPRLAARLDRLSLIRSLHHHGDPTHAAGLQILDSGSADGSSPPLGARVAAQLGGRGGVPPVIVLPQPISAVDALPTRDQRPADRPPWAEPFVVGGVPGASGYDPARLADRLARWLDRAAEGGMPTTEARPALASNRLDWTTAPARKRAGFEASAFGRSCWLAARLAAAGTRLITVPMAPTVFGLPSWDAHGRRPWSTWDDYAATLLPSFDTGVSALLDHLAATGRLDSTLVVATGEMGRTPWINESGGRDHWPGAWSGLVAGGGTAGGRVVGATDGRGQIIDGPVPLVDLVALMARHLGLEPATASQPDGRNLAALLT